MPTSIENNKQTKGFFFDLNKCVGCHACVVACEIENGTEQHQPWRAISTFNAFQNPDLPVFHYSLACNHCEDAPCMYNCPAVALIRDNSMQTIEHLADRCIGCKYCTWACPYDAPKFIETTGVVEKCTLCRHRLDEDKKPACANLCPTGALDYREIKIKEQNRIAGFTEAGVLPKIEIVELRRKKGPEMALSLSGQEHKDYRKLSSVSRSKISLNKEWTLVLFTLMVAVMNGYFTAGMLGFSDLSPWLFTGIGFFSIALSSVHLGKKHLAWRAILNVKDSWLSREILFYSLFLSLGLLWFFLPEIKYIGYAAIFFGFTAAWSVDKVYYVLIPKTRIDWHSSSIFLSSLLFMSLLSGNYRFVAGLLILKFLLYVYRKIYFQIHGLPYKLWLSLARTGIGFIIPLLTWPAHGETFSFVFILAIALGEFIDRIEFYQEADAITPEIQIEKDLLRSLDNQHS